MPYIEGGLNFKRYAVFKRGSHEERVGTWFCLNCDGSDPHALEALKSYADSVKKENPNLCEEIYTYLSNNFWKR